MKEGKRKTGIEIIGDASWGTHLCQFYQTKKDLIEILVPYFKAGLENNEFCIWVTSEPLEAKEAEASLSKAVRNLDKYIRKGQIEILDYSGWYTKSGKFNADEVLQGWVEKEKAALKRGFDGLRLTGNTFWLEKTDWKDFNEYERTVDSIVGNHKILAICSYSMGQCHASDITDVISAHGSALIRKEGRWALTYAERERMKEAAQVSEERYKAIFESANDVLLLLDRRGRILDINKRIKDIGGYEKEDLVGKNISSLGKLMPKKSLAIIVKNFAKRMAGINVAPYEVEMFSENRELKIIEIRATPVRNDGQGIGELVVLRDVTEQKRKDEALQQSEENLRVYLESAPDAVYLNDLKGTFLYGNRKAEEITGYKKEELIGQSFLKLKLLPQKHLLKAAELLALNAMGKPTGPDEFRLVRKDGRQTCIEISTTPIKVRGETVVIGCARDITERKQMEERIRIFSKAVAGAIDAIAIADMKGTITYVNPAMEALYGYEKGEMLGKSVISLNRNPEMANEIMLAMTKTGSWNGEIESIKKNKETFPALLSLSTVRDEKGNPIVMMGALREITERKQAEEALKQSEAKYRTLIGRLQEGVYQSDLNGYYVTINKAGAKIFGFDSPEQLIGKYTTIDLFYDLNDRAKIIEELRRTGSFIGEVRAKRRDGTVIWLEVNNNTTLDEKGNIIGYEGMFSDITQRKEMEAERRELEQKALAANHLASVGQMASGMAHEINNPLTAVIGFSDLLLGGEIHGDIRKDVETINGAAQRVADILKRMLTFARQYKPERKYVCINEILKTTLDMRIYQLEVGNINLTCQLDPKLPKTMADAAQIQQVFLNIIQNAEMEMKSAHGGGNFLVGTEAVDNTIRISFKDDGRGISKENMKKLFQPFFTTKPVGEGTGLGLSVCYGIVSEHGGRIYAESEFGKGANFIVELPVVAETKETEQRELSVDEARKAVNAKILVVDDEPDVRNVLTRVRQKYGL